jgi:8-oxo-dGTP pyrophosphatase MutT (NUDIX family)
MKIVSFEKSVGAVVFRKENNDILYLLLKSRAGHWTFPKGHTEKGESDEETFRREIKEETCITKLEVIPGFLNRTKYFYVAKGEERQERKGCGRSCRIFKRVYYYLAETEVDKITLCNENVDYAWLTYEEALERVSYSNCKNILIKAHNFLDNVARTKNSGRIDL